jgi:hypothetical protein
MMTMMTMIRPSSMVAMAAADSSMPLRNVQLKLQLHLYMGEGDPSAKEGLTVTVTVTETYGYRLGKSELNPPYSHGRNELGRY